MKNVLNRVTIFTAVLLTGSGQYACKDTTTVVNPPVVNCINDEPVDYTSLQECNPPQQDTSWCELIEIGETWMLSMKAKEWLPQYCQDNGSSVVFRNDAGNVMSFTLSKNHSISLTGHNGFDECTQDSTKSYWYCSQAEGAAVSLTGLQPEIAFSVGIKKELEHPIAMDYRLGERLIISIIRQGQLLTYEQLLSMVIVRGDLDDDPAPDNLEYFESLTLNGRTFRNVFSMYFPEPFAKDYKVYYNQTVGLLAFEDPEKVTWVIE